MSLVSDGVCKFVQARFVDFKSVQSEGYLGSVESMLAQSFQSAQEVLHVQRRETLANDIGDIVWNLFADPTYERLRSQGFRLHGKVSGVVAQSTRPSHGSLAMFIVFAHTIKPPRAIPSRTC